MYQATDAPLPVAESSQVVMTGVSALPRTPRAYRRWTGRNSGPWCRKFGEEGGDRAVIGGKGRHHQQVARKCAGKGGGIHQPEHRESDERFGQNAAENDRPAADLVGKQAEERQRKIHAMQEINTITSISLREMLSACVP